MAEKTEKKNDWLLAASAAAIGIAGGLTIMQASKPLGYTLKVTVSPANSGSITKTPESVTYAQGTTVKVAATPNQGYVFSRYIQNGVTVSTSPNINVNINSNVELTAVFIATTGGGGDGSVKYDLNVFAQPSNGGKITIDPDKGTYSYGEKVTLTAVPYGNYVFQSWQSADGSILGTGIAIEITITENTQIYAIFSSVSGMVTNVTAVQSYLTPGVDTAQVNVIWKNTSSVPLQAPYFQLQIRLNGILESWKDKSAFYTTPATVAPGASITVLCISEKIPADWINSDIDAKVMQQNTATTVWAKNNFFHTLGSTPPQETYTLGVMINHDWVNNAIGTVTIDPKLDRYTKGSIVYLDAFPASGWQFSKWEVVSGSITFSDPTSPEIAVTINSNLVLEATFTAVPSESGNLSIVGDHIVTVIPDPLVGDYQVGFMQFLGQNNFSRTVNVICYAGVNYIDYSGQTTDPPYIRKTMAPGEIAAFAFNFNIPNVPHSTYQTFTVMARILEEGSTTICATAQHTITIFHTV